jgi:hypothetical protein
MMDAEPNTATDPHEPNEPVQEEFVLGAGINFADPNSRLAPLYLRTSGVVAAAALAAVFLLMTYVRVWHTDVWAHLRFGEYMVQQRQLPTREMWSGDFADQDALYVNYQWVAQAGAYLLFDLGQRLALPDPDHQLGGGALLLSTAHALIVTLRLLLLLFAFRRLTGSLPFALVGVFLALGLSLSHLRVLRPQILGELAVAALLLPLSRPLLSRRALFLVPLVFVLWANCHGSFLIGFLLVGLFLAGRVLEVALAEGSPFSVVRVVKDEQTRRLAAVLVLSVAAVAVCNPHGPALLLYTSELGRNPNIPFMEEWKPLPPRSPSGYLFVASVLLLVPLLRWSPARFTPTQLLLLAVFGWQTLAHARMLVWWSTLYAWAVLPHLEALGRRWLPGLLRETRPPDLRKTILAGLTATVLVLWSAPLLWLCWGEAPVAAQRVTAETPVEVCRSLERQYRRQPGLGRTVFTSETLGDYVLWALRPEPPVRVFCYTHVHLLTPEHWRECMLVKSADHRWPEVLDRHGVQFLIVEAGLYGPLIQQVQAASDRWQVQATEPIFVARRRATP